MVRTSLDNNDSLRKGARGGAGLPGRRGAMGNQVAGAA